MSSIEQSAQAAVSANLIALYGVPVALERPGLYQRTPGGGAAPSGEPERLSEVRRFFGRVERDALQNVNLEGDQAMVWGILLGLPGDDIQKDDQFIGPDGLKYTVRYIERETASFETRAEVFALV